MLHLFKESVEFNLHKVLPQMELPIVTGAAFYKARYKIQSACFKSLLHQIVKFQQQHTTPKLWKGHRLVAADGTTLSLPNSAQINEHYGITSDRKMSLANVFTFYDALSQIILDTIITTESVSEKVNFRQMLDHIDGYNDLVLLDAGFGYFHICKHLYQSSKQFCIRIDTNITQFAKSFKTMPATDQIVLWTPSNAEYFTCKRHSLDTQAIKVRVVKIIENGKEVLLVSSLLNQNKYSTNDIKDLYNYRWNAEEGFKKLKTKMKIEYFGCKKVQGIEQEFYIHACIQNIVTILVNEIEPKISSKFKHRKLKYKCNWQNAYRFLREKIILLLTKDTINDILAHLINQIKSSVIAIKTGRKFERKPKKPKRRYYQVYK